MAEHYSLFDIFIIEALNGFDYLFDGLPGERVLFISNDNIRISFEEGMDCLDMNESNSSTDITLKCEHKVNSKYIHQKRIVHSKNDDACDFAFFHIELAQANGKKMSLAGQMVADKSHQWSDGVEPVLISILDKISLKTEEVNK